MIIVTNERPYRHTGSIRYIFYNIVPQIPKFQASHPDPSHHSSVPLKLNLKLDIPTEANSRRHIPLINHHVTCHILLKILNSKFYCISTQTESPCRNTTSSANPSYYKILCTSLLYLKYSGQPIFHFTMIMRKCL